HTHAHTHTHIHTHTHTQTHRSNMQMHMHHSGKHTLTVNERNLIYVNSNDMGHPNVHTFITLCLSLAFPLFSLPLFYTHTRTHTTHPWTLLHDAHTQSPMPTALTTHTSIHTQNSITHTCFC